MLIIVSAAIRLPAAGPNRRSAITSTTLPCEPGEVADRHRVDVEDVEQSVHDDHRGGAEPQRPGHEARRIAHLLGDVGGRVPARVAEHHRHQREQPAGRRDAAGVGGEVGDVAFAEREAEADEQQERRHLRAGEHVLQEAAGAHAPDVHERQRGDQPDRKQRLWRERHRHQRRAALPRSGACREAAGTKRPR